ncbi:hypothetical protein [Streptomyces aureoverticillatus]|uniref:hypothetical protein n=1 Tax=Streptomyces aureoverticillatus TaxID=66871 RepID=UPI0013DBD5C0|nr:hypothetical protein [Streptomyces aureoverticillatus]QIB47755.1 hypothetical protein G3H79_36440 [Streptomyces aureoverticillatus]
MNGRARRVAVDDPNETAKAAAGPLSPPVFKRRWRSTIRSSFRSCGAPDNIREHLGQGTSLIQDRCSVSITYDRLDQRVVEVCDATYELLPWIDEDLPARAPAAARSTANRSPPLDWKTSRRHLQQPRT